MADRKTVSQKYGMSVMQEGDLFYVKNKDGKFVQEDGKDKSFLTKEAADTYVEDNKPATQNTQRTQQSGDSKEVPSGVVNNVEDKHKAATGPIVEANAKQKAFEAEHSPNPSSGELGPKPIVSQVTDHHPSKQAIDGPLRGTNVDPSGGAVSSIAAASANKHSDVK